MIIDSTELHNLKTPQTHQYLLHPNLFSANVLQNIRINTISK